MRRHPTTTAVMKRWRAALFGSWLATIVLLSACAAAPTRTDELLARLRPPGPPPSDDGGVYADLLTELGREDLVDATRAKAEPCRPLVRAGVLVDPLAEIVRRARDAQVVIINEAHDQPRGRVFIEAVARRLRPLGFDLYAAEAFAPSIGRHGPKYPLVSDGYYVNEPVYGALVRALRALKYELISYEWFPPPGAQQVTEVSAGINRDDEGMAELLMARIFRPHPRARVLIHVGYSHAREVAQDDIHWLALRLKQKTGIDPLTVDQTSFGPAGDRYVACAADRDGAALDTAFDLQIMPPALQLERGRPVYRLAGGGKPIAMPAKLRRPRERVLVEAHRADEPDSAVPIDRILLEADDDLPLILPRGRYRVRARPVKASWSTSVMLEAP